MGGHGIQNRPLIRNDWHEYDSRRGMIRYDRLAMLAFVVAGAAIFGSYLCDFTSLFSGLL